jgi:hypothetical protein
MSDKKSGMIKIAEDSDTSKVSPLWIDVFEVDTSDTEKVYAEVRKALFDSAENDRYGPVWISIYKQSKEAYYKELNDRNRVYDDEEAEYYGWEKEDVKKSNSD